MAMFVVLNFRKGASIKYVRTIFWDFRPPSPLSAFPVLFVHKISQFLNRPSPLGADVLNVSPLLERDRIRFPCTAPADGAADVGTLTTS